MDERVAVQARLERCEALLEAARNDAETERKLKESLHSDYADARRQLIAKDGEVIELIGRLSRLETELSKVHPLETKRFYNAKPTSPLSL